MVPSLGKSGPGPRPLPAIHKVASNGVVGRAREPVPRSRKKTLEPGMTCMGTALDRRSNQAVDAEARAQHVQKIELFLGKLTVGCSNVAGERISGLAEFRRQRFGDDVAGLIEPILLAQQIGAVPADLGQALMLEIAKNRQIAHQPADRLDLCVGHDPFGRRHQNHGVDQRAVMIDGLRHLLDILREIVMFPVGGRHPAGG